MIRHIIIAKVQDMVQRVTFMVDDINSFINASPDALFVVSDELTNKTCTVTRQDLNVISIYN